MMPKNLRGYFAQIIIFDKSSYQSFSQVETIYKFYQESLCKFVIIVGFINGFKDVCFDEGRELALALDAIYIEVGLDEKNQYQVIFELIARECLNRLLSKDNLKI